MQPTDHKRALPWVNDGISQQPRDDWPINIHHSGHAIPFAMYLVYGIWEHRGPYVWKNELCLMLLNDLCLRC